MKKSILNLTIIIIFIVYSLFAKAHGAGQVPVVMQKKVVASTTAPTSTVTPSPTPMPTGSTPVTPTQTSVPTPTPTATPTPTSASGYKNGTFTGSAADAIYGSIQVQAVIKGGRITDVKFLQAPNTEPNSVYINQQADPMLTQEAISAQSANVDIVSGATDSSQAFQQSLQSALNQAQQ
jgi:uncharacterized protein with FMN-binding domain